MTLSVELGAAIPVSAQCEIHEDARLIASDAAAGDSYGNHVSISGDTAVVNAPSEDNAGGIDAGSVYVYRFNGSTWVEQAKLTASDAAAGDFFGSKVSISGDTLVVGAPYDDHASGIDAGSAYVFVRTGTVWTQQGKLTATDATAGDLFAFWVAVSDDTIVLGASHEDNDAGTNAGSAYVFVKPPGGWTDMTQTAKLTASDAAANDEFGYSVSISGDTIIVGAISDDHDGGPANAGTGYVFVRGHNGNNVWDNGSLDQQAKLIASDAGVGDGLGHDVAIDGDTAVLGADYNDHSGATDAGAAYVFVRSGGTWTQQAKLIASDAATDDIFGNRVSLSGNVAAVGAHHDDHAGAIDAGSAYVFVRPPGGWANMTETAKLTASDAALDDQFGSVATNGNTVFVAAWSDDHSAGTDAGSAYVFDLSPLGTDCNNNSIPDECDIANCPPNDPLCQDCNGNGVLDGCELAGIEQAKLVASDAAAGDWFGISAALSGDTAVVGAILDDDACSTDPNCNSGSAYVFVRSGGVWAEQVKLTASDATADDRLGYSAALSGDTAVVGTLKGESAYVFVRSGGVWTQQAKLIASDPAAGDGFGNSVALSSETVVIGAGGDDHAGGANAGSAYVFVRSGGVWTQQAKLIAADAASADHFGASVAVSGNTTVVGAGDDTHSGGASAGSAYVFVRSGSAWTQQTKLIASDAAASDGFGVSVAVSTDTALVGAVGDDHAGGTGAGSAYVFVRSGSVWTQQAKLVAFDAASGDIFGRTVALSGDTAVVGAPFDDDAGTSSGSAYVFLRSAGLWTQQAKLTAFDAAAEDQFSTIAVAVSGDTAVVGAYYDTHAGGTNAGSAYVFQVTGISDCNANGVPDECEVPPICPTCVDCNDNGIPDACEADCNGNDIPDECDIANCPPNDPSCRDCNENGIPDGCEPPLSAPDILWNTDPLSATRASRTLTMLLSPVTVELRTAALGIKMVDLQHPNPRNRPANVTPNFTAFDTRLNGVCSGATVSPNYNGHHCDSDADCICSSALSPSCGPATPISTDDGVCGPALVGCGAADGCVRWVGPVTTFREKQGVPGLGTYKAGRLQCTPYYTDWTALGTFSVFGAEIIPSSTYETQSFDSVCQCDESTCTNVSPPMTMLTRRSGDVAPAWNPGTLPPSEQPDGNDVGAVLDKFKGTPGSPSNIAALIFGNLPDPNTDVGGQEIGETVNAFKGLAYAFSGPCACPSTVTSGATACTSTDSSPCGAGLCVITCQGGLNDGLPCRDFPPNTPADHCPGGSCPTNGFCRDRCGRCN